jgi:hypothetical protein
LGVPIISYFLVVGASLLGLLFWIDANYAAGLSPIKTTQTAGLPQPYKSPTRVVEVLPVPVVSEAKIEAKIDAAKPTKIAHRQKPRIKIVRNPEPTEQVAQYRMRREVLN